MILTEKINDFVGKALTKLRELQTDLIDNFDRNGYQSVKSDELLLYIGETFDFIELLQVEDHGTLTDREVSDLIDFFIKQLDLNEVIAANYIFYKMPVLGAGGGSGGLPPTSGGAYATIAQLGAEVSARIAADAALDARIDALEAASGGEVFPPGFFDNFLGTYSVVFDDDPRLHLHLNFPILEQLNDIDLANIKMLTAHYASIGDPGGMHVSSDDRARWDAGGGGGIPVPPGVYDLGSPSTVVVGGLPAGSVLTGRTWQSIIEEMAVDYLLPGFTSFNITGMPSLIEVGIAVGGAHVFTWGTSNSNNVAPNSIAIRDVTGNVLIASGLANDGSESVDIGTITNTAPMSRSWRAEALNTNAGSFVSGNRGTTSIYPYFFGKVSSGGADPGLSRPVATQALVAGGSKVVASSANTITIDFASGSDDYIWFAIPASMASKNSWFVNALNNGLIGGTVGPGGNLFPDPDVISIDSPTVLWAGVNYKIYISNYQSAVSALMELRNT